MFCVMLFCLLWTLYYLQSFPARQWLEFFTHDWNNHSSFDRLLINQMKPHLCLFNVLASLNFNNVHFTLKFFAPLSWPLLSLYDILEQCRVVTYSNLLQLLMAFFVKCHLLPDGLVLTSVNHHHLLSYTQPSDIYYILGMQMEVLTIGPTAQLFARHELVRKGMQTPRRKSRNTISKLWRVLCQNAIHIMYSPWWIIIHCFKNKTKRRLNRFVCGVGEQSCTFGIK